MQTRKVVVDVKTIDDEHCSRKCNFLHKTWTRPYCLIEGVIKQDHIGYLRTSECKKGEVK